eukprot:gene1117-1185_t
MKQLIKKDTKEISESSASEKENGAKEICDPVPLVKNEDSSALKHQFWLTRIIFLRFLAFMYLVAFFIAFHQNSSLIGERGLTPAKSFIQRYRDRFPSAHAAFLAHPTLFWYIEPSNRNLEGVALLGGGISFVMVVLGHGSMCMLAVLWLAYMSIVNVGQTWYSFGWESQLLEMGFLSMFAVPLLGGWWGRLWRLIRGRDRKNNKRNKDKAEERKEDTNPDSTLDNADYDSHYEEEDMEDGRFPAWTRCGWVVVWGNRWLLFRIMLGAGLIKIRGDECWRDLTCMKYHYETQPVPNPVSIYYHSTPEAFHRVETMVNHVVELLAPWLLLFPDNISLWKGGMLGKVGRVGQMIGGAVQIIFQIVLITSGNYAFLNWLTIAPAIFSFDDAAVAFLFSKEDRERAMRVERRYKTFITGVSQNEVHGNYGSVFENIRREYFHYPPRYPSIVIAFRRLLGLSLAIVIAYLSYPVVLNLASPRQVMNMTYEPFRLVNTYGLFGGVTKVRNEVIFQATSDVMISEKTKWKEFQFRCKPGDINRTPCIITPYHLRIDWLMWFAAFQNYQQCPWIVHIAYKLLRGDEVVEDLFDPKNGNPFREESAAPRYVRAMLYEYRYRRVFGMGKEEEEMEEEERRNGWEFGRYWKRRMVGNYLPVIEKNNPSVEEFLKAHAMI